MTAGAGAEWPTLNTLCWVRIAEFASELPSRIEDVEDNRVNIAIPSDPSGNALSPPRSGVEFFIGWTNKRAALEVPVSFVDLVETNVQTWRCQAIGEPIETQRRNFVRANISFEVTLDLFEPSPAISARGIDISEGGLRVSLDRWALDPGAKQFQVVIPLSEGPVEVTAQVIWWGNLEADERRTAGLRFVNLDQRTADTVRREVFALQLEQRRRQ